MGVALAFQNLELVPLSPEILVVSTQLPQPFHRDPADQIIVATARQRQISLLTEDKKILDLSSRAACLSSEAERRPASLRGSVLRFDQPFEQAAAGPVG